MEIIMKKGIIFDLDGTLWDSIVPVTHGWNVALDRHPELNCHITEDDMRGFMGKTNPTIARLMLPDLTPDAAYEIVKECAAEELIYLKDHPGALYPGIEKLLKELGQEYPLYIVSNCDDGYVQTFLDVCGFRDYFEDFEMSGRTRKEKGENIRLIMERNQLERAVYIGDTQGDLDASHAAGIPFIYAAYGFGSVNEDVPSVQEPSQISQAIARILKKMPG